MEIAPVRQPVCAAVSVEAPARVHLGFVDLDEPLGRRLGNLGLTVQGNATHLKVAPARTLKVTGPAHAASRALAYAALLTERLGLPGGLDIEVLRAIPDHAGLGSGTQMMLALATGLARLYGLDLDARELATLAGRGTGYGICIGAFERGGFLLDSGCGGQERTTPVMVQRDFPESWCILLVFDRAGRGIHRKRENAAQRSLPAFSQSCSAALSRLVTTQALPALSEGDCLRFGHAIGQMQRVIGDYFAPVQAGRFASSEVAEVLSWIASRGIAGVGQSSWGPTGFAFLPDQTAADDLLQRLRVEFAGRPNLRFETTCARNHGSRIEVCTVGAGRMTLRAAV